MVDASRFSYLSFFSTFFSKHGCVVRTYSMIKTYCIFGVSIVNFLSNAHLKTL